MSPVCAVSVKTGHGTAAFPFWKNYARQLWQTINESGCTGSYFHTGTAIHCWISFLVVLLNPDCSVLECHLLVTVNVIFLSQSWEGSVILKFLISKCRTQPILEPTLHKNFPWKSSCGMSQIAQTSWRSPLQNQGDPVREEDGQRWMEKQHLFIYSEKTPCTEMPIQKHLGQHITNELAFFSHFSIPTLRSYNTLEEIKKGRHTLQSSQEVTCWEQQHLLNSQCLWHCKSTPPLQVQPQTQTSTCLMVTADNHCNQTGHWSSQRATSFQGEPWLYWPIIS